MTEDTRVLTETPCADCMGKGYYAPDKRKPGHVWDCPACKGKKVIRRAITLVELRDAIIKLGNTKG